MHRILSRTWEYAASTNPITYGAATALGIGAALYGASELGVTDQVADLVRACVSYIAGMPGRVLG